MRKFLNVVAVFSVFVFVSGFAHADNGYIYAVGQGDSDSLRVSMEKAKLDGEFGLAKQVGSQGTTVSLVGYQVVRQEIKPIQGRFHTYVLVRIAESDLTRR